jgi:phosphatidylglycerol:prolipoprotein diacylglycerol transferase
MQSELLRIPYQWQGVPIFGVGLLLAVWAIAAVVIVTRLVRAHGWGAETWSTLPVLLFVGAAILVLPRVFPDGLPVRGYGVLMVAGITSGVALAIRRALQVGLDHELILSLTIWLVIGGVLGARLFYVIEYWEEKFAGHSLAQTLAEVANIPQGGLVVYGGLIGAAAAFLLFTRKYRLPVLPLADIVAPSLAIGLALGRVGCFLNGCCYGGPSELPWAVTFPKYATRYEDSRALELRRYSPPYTDQAAHGELHGFRLEEVRSGEIVVARVEPASAAAVAGLKVGDPVRGIGGIRITSLDDAERLIFQRFTAGLPLIVERGGGDVVTIAAIEMPARSRPIHPAQLYSAIDAGLLCWLTWCFYPFRRRDGQVIALLLTIHPVTRFLLEIIRTDEPAVFGTGLSISQNISLGILVLAGGLWWYSSRQKPATYNWSTWQPVPETGPPAGRAKDLRVT